MIDLAIFDASLTLYFWKNQTFFNEYNLQQNEGYFIHIF